jgi:serine protease Do
MQAKPAYWLLAVVLAVQVVQLAAQPSAAPNATQTNRPAGSDNSSQPEQAADAEFSTLLAAPRPTPAYRTDLRAPFTKTTPTSLADLKTMEQHIRALAACVSPAVVAVQVGSGRGSGVVISTDGLVLTAGHVCGGPDRNVGFTFPDGKTARGKTVGVYLESDTGLMRITDRGPWPFAPVGDLQQARIGDWVLALGHPGGFDLRRSLVVRLGRITQFRHDALQTDCTISPGDSGGPLFDMYGRVIGIHSAISSSPAENFHVSITEFYDGWAELVKGLGGDNQAKRLRAFVGARGVDDTAGCRLTVVDENSPASNAGLKVGDVVLKVDGREVKLYSSFLRWVAEAEPGEMLNLEVKRGDQLLTLELKLEAPRGRSP